MNDAGEIAELKRKLVEAESALRLAKETLVQIGHKRDYSTGGAYNRAELARATIAVMDEEAARQKLPEVKP